MITYLLYKYGILKKGNAIDGFTSMYTMTLDLVIVGIVGLLIYKWIYE